MTPELLVNLLPWVLSVSTGMIVFSLVIGVYDFFDKPKTEIKKDNQPGI